MLKISPEEFADIIQRHNQWKGGKENLDRFAPAHERPLVRVLADALLVDNPQPKHQVVIGPRQAGKSTVLRQTIRSLLGEGVHEERIFYVQMDAMKLRPETLESVMSGIFEIAEPPTHDDPLFLLMDEITKTQAWGDAAKEFYDSKSPVRLLVTGSSPLDLYSGLNDTAPGRWLEHYLMPCNFCEYASWVLGESALPRFTRTAYPSLRDRLADISADMALDDRLYRLCDEFLVLSGYPELVASRPASLLMHDQHSFSNQILRSQDVLLLIAERVVYKDIARTEGIRDAPKLDETLFSLAEMTRKEIGRNKLSKNLGINPNTLDSYIDAASRSLVAFCLKKHSGSAAGTSPRGRRVFFHDSGMSNAIRGTENSPIDDPDIRADYLENAVAAGLKELALMERGRLSWWKDAKDNEVDFVYEKGPRILGFEIAASRSHHRKGVEAFVAAKEQAAGNTYMVSPRAPIVKASISPKGIGSMPVCVLLLAIGAQAIQHMLRRGSEEPCDNYRIEAEQLKIYPRHTHETQQHTFKAGDIVYLTRQEAEPHLAAGTITKAETFAV